MQLAEQTHPKVVCGSLTYPSVACFGGILQNVLMSDFRVVNRRVLMKA
jgi:hypothetical protein